MTEEKQPAYVVGAVAVQTQPVIVHTATQEQFDVHTALAKVLSELEDVKKALR